MFQSMISLFNVKLKYIISEPFFYSYFNCAIKNLSMKIENRCYGETNRAFLILKGIFKSVSLKYKILSFDINF